MMVEMFRDAAGKMTPTDCAQMFPLKYHMAGYFILVWGIASTPGPSGIYHEKEKSLILSFAFVYLIDEALFGTPLCRRSEIASESCPFSGRRHRSSS